MKPLTLMLLLAASAGREVLTDEHLVPPGDWKFREIQLHGRPARISGNFQVLNGSHAIRAALMLRQDLEWMDGDLSSSIVVTGAGQSGAFADRLRRTGDYVIVLDNQEGKQTARVQLNIELDYGQASLPEVTQLPPARRISIVIISFAAFLAIVGMSTRKLLRNMR